MGIMKDGEMVYFGPYDATAISTHMPVDNMLQEATVEGKESATAAKAKEAGKVRFTCEAADLPLLLLTRRQCKAMI